MLGYFTSLTSREMENIFYHLPAQELGQLTYRGVYNQDCLKATFYFSEIRESMC